MLSFRRSNETHLSSLICWIALAILTLVTAAYLSYLNRRHATMRVNLGKKAEVIDTSLEAVPKGGQGHQGPKEGLGDAVNEKAFDDLTDLQNEDFIYVL